MKEYAFSIDLGGTTANFSLFSRDGIKSVWTVPTPESDIAGMIESEILNKIEELNMQGSDFKAVVIGIAGVVKNGIVLEAANLKGIEPDIAGILESRLGIETIVLNDVNLLALGESVNYDNLFLVTIGTGIGAGLVINNRIVEGFNGAAGEIGHIYLESETPEENASAKGLVKTVQNYLKSNETPSKLRNFNNLTAKEIFHQGELGDEVALQIIYNIYFKFGKLLGVICSAFDPEVIIISGGLSNAGNLLIDPIRDGYHRTAFKKCEIKTSEFKEKAAVYGAFRLIGW